MNTETTEYAKGWLFYDADCAICRGSAHRTHGILLRHGFHQVPLQSDWAGTRLNLTAGEPLLEMKLLTRDGRIHGGADAVVRIAQDIWWLWPFFLFAQLPGVKVLLRFAYRHFAARRYCVAGKCALPHRCEKANPHKTSSFYEMP